MLHLQANVQPDTTSKPLPPVCASLPLSTPSCLHASPVLLRNVECLAASQQASVTGQKTAPPLATMDNLPSLAAVLIVELCCGTAGYSSAFVRRGINALGVDYDRNPASPMAPSVKIDLASVDGQLLIRELFQAAPVVYAHGAVPCGTASKARERPISSKLLAAGAPAPRQLRSRSQPYGFPRKSNDFPNGLTECEQLRVTLANRIYDFVCNLFFDFHHKILWSLENPTTSYFWLVPSAVRLSRLPGVKSSDFQQCQHGGSRPVWRRWLANFDLISELEATCSGETDTHKHENFSIAKSDAGWKFSTAGEAAYPRLLCERACDIVIRSLLQKGFQPVPETLASSGLNDVQCRQLNRASAGKFVRGNKLLPIISEFAYTALSVLSNPVKGALTMFGGRHAKILRVGKRVNVGPSDSGQSGEFECAIGVYRTPSEFAAKCSDLLHPVDMPSTLPATILHNIVWNLEHTSLQISKFLVRTLKDFSALAVKLKPRNLELLSKVPAHARSIVGDKHLALLEHFIEKLDWPDKALIKDLTEGFKLTGTMRPSGIFPFKLKQATVSTDQLRKSAVWTRKATIAKVRPSDIPGLDETLWQQLELEFERKWCSGPFTEEEVSNLLSTDQWICNRRFGLVQKSKVRDIDDYSESGVNDATTTVDKIVLDDIDTAVDVLRVVISAVHEDRIILVSLPDGTQLRAKLAPDVTTAQARDWVGKCFDLKAAYKNLFTHADERWLSIICLWSPRHQRPMFALQDAMPFGASAAVVSFNRCSKLLCAIIASEFRIVILSYFDDFPTFSRRGVADMVDKCIRSIFRILGWSIAEGDKCPPFAAEFNLLGVRLLLQEIASGLIQAANKEDRVESLTEEIDSILVSGKCPRPQAASFRGKAHFAANQMFGRVALPLLASLTEHQFRSRTLFITERLRNELESFRALIQNTAPRQLQVLGEVKPVLIFGDAACEGADFENVSCGAVLFDTVSKQSFMWGLMIPEDVVAFWKSDRTGKLQCIGQAELVTPLLAAATWDSRLRHRRILVFCDNDSARAALVKCVSDSPSSTVILRALVQRELACPSWSFYCRVPSHSNPGDGPSRLRLQPAGENLFSTLTESPSLDVVRAIAISGIWPFA